jgi:hypothetical protein
MRRVTVGDYVVYVLQSLSALALRRLGVTEATKDEKDLDQARLAIDAFDALLQVVGPARPPQERQAHREVLSQLRIAWIASSSTRASAGLPEEPAPESDAAPQSDVAPEAAPDARATREADAPAETDALAETDAAGESEGGD